jgi:pimeloyl-ACP methyl ester carboxylesterase
MKTVTPLTLTNAPRSVAEHRARLQYLPVDGGHLAYVDEGAREGKTMLLLHGMPTSSWMWRKLIPMLSGAGLRVVAPDLLGFGASDKPADLRQYTLERQARRLISLLNALSLERVTLVIHDLGGAWGSELIDRVPERIKRVVVLNTSVYRDGFKPPALVKMLGGPMGAPIFAMMRSRALGFRMMTAFFKQFVGDPSLMDAAAVEGYWRSLSEGTVYPFQQFAQSFPTFYEQFPRYQAALRRIDAPAMLIWGAHDPVCTFDKLSAQFAADLRIPRERIHLLSSASHFLAEDRAPDIAGRILTFIRETGTRQE